MSEGDAQPPRGGRGGQSGRPPRRGNNRQGANRQGGSGQRQGRPANRKRVSPALRIGITVAPADVPRFASQFRVLEADAGAEILTDRVVGPWVDRTPDGFVVDVRAHRLLTHHPAAPETIWPDVRDALSPSLRARRHVYADDLPARALDAALDRFLASLAVAREFAKIGTVVFPFPSYFRPNTKSLDYLAWLRGRSAGVPIAVELRHREWVDSAHRAATMKFLEEQELAYVCVDAPSGFESSLPPLSVMTAAPAMVRFHGRNADAWERDVDTGDDRFPSEYRRADLDAWVPRLEKLAAGKQPVHAIVTTRGNDGASRNARLLVRALTEEPAPAPPPASPARGPKSRRSRPR
jgi:uncharacterized protein YecE (DUF72 family)